LGLGAIYGGRDWIFRVTLYIALAATQKPRRAAHKIGTGREGILVLNGWEERR